MSKTELEFLVFNLLVAQKNIDLGETDNRIAAKLQTTPQRVRSLRYRWEQREWEPALTMGNYATLVARIHPFEIEDTPTGEKYVRVRVESPYVLGWLRDEMHARGFLVLDERTTGVIRVKPGDLVVTLAAFDMLTTEEGQKLSTAVLTLLKKNSGTLPKLFRGAKALAPTVSLANDLSELINRHG